MTWVEPKHSKTEVKKAGRLFMADDRSREEKIAALAVINNWRSAHAFPLNTMQVKLRRLSKDYDPDALVAQRIKRLPSIVKKLERYPSMDLSRMQDLGGARAVLTDMRDVDQALVAFAKSRSRHALHSQKDYVAQPKESGYRGVHLVYRYSSARPSPYEGLMIELQIRTRMQHAWATAVETVGTFTKQALKSGQGERVWLRFFALMSSEIAALEGRPTVPETPDETQERVREIRELARDLDVVRKLKAFGTTLRHTEDLAHAARFFVLELDAADEVLRIHSFKDLRRATEFYDDCELRTVDEPWLDIVLVAVDSLSQLRKAYPNYFLDTGVFLNLVQEVL